MVAVGFAFVGTGVQKWEWSVCRRLTGWKLLPVENINAT